MTLDELRLELERRPIRADELLVIRMPAGARREHLEQLREALAGRTPPGSGLHFLVLADNVELEAVPAGELRALLDRMGQ